MKKLLGVLFLLALCNPVFAQTGGTQSAVGVSCPANGGAASVQALALNARRVSYSINNDSAIDVRIGFLSSGTSNLDDTNSFILKAGQVLSDSVPGVYYGRVVCESNTTSATTVHVTETQR